MINQDINSKEALIWEINSVTDIKEVTANIILAFEVMKYFMKIIFIEPTRVPDSLSKNFYVK